MRTRKEITDSLKALSDGPAHGPGEHDQAMKETIIEILLDVRDKVCDTGERAEPQAQAQSNPRFTHCRPCGQAIELERGRFVTHTRGIETCPNSGRPA